MVETGAITKRPLSPIGTSFTGADPDRGEGGSCGVSFGRRNALP
jgi:hypothetical protein